MSSELADTIVIGAGVVGLAIARQLALDGREVLVLEANGAFGMETSSRNSGVIHAGIYYPPGSLKSRCCVDGKALLYDYCATRHIPHKRCGKLIVAENEGQQGQLKDLWDNAREAGVDDIEWLDIARFKEMEPAVRACSALFSPSTGIIDVHELMLAFLADLEANGGMLVTHSRVLSGRRVNNGFELMVDNGGEYTLHAKKVINAAGHGATGIARKLSGLAAHKVPVISPIRGHYFEYAGKLPFSHLIYPLPGVTGLGIHVTMDLAGQFRFGPDAEKCETLDYRFDETRKSRFSEAINQWFPELDESRLRPGYVGIRPALLDSQGKPGDFIISGPEDHGVDGLVNLFGVDSPGLTACMAIAAEITNRFPLP